MLNIVSMSMMLRELLIIQENQKSFYDQIFLESHFGVSMWPIDMK